MRTGSCLPIVIAVAVVWLVAPPARAQVTADRLVNASREPQQWLTYSGSYDGSRFSPLDQINRTNVQRLTLQWVFQSGVRGWHETTPLVVDGVMYLTTPDNHAYAVDVRTGRPLWHYQRTLPKDLSLCCGPQNRGLAALGDRVFMGTLDAHVVALDARTGRVRWDVAAAEGDKGYSLTGAPLAVKDKVIVGVAGGEYGIRGFIDAYDAESGKRVWRFYTIPGEGERGNETWKGDSWKRGGAPTWVTGSYDPELNTVYWAMGNPAPQIDRFTRDRVSRCDHSRQRFRRALASQLGNRNRRAEHHRVKRINLESGQRSPKTEFENIVNVAAEMIDHVSQGRCGERGSGQSKSSVLLEVPDVGGKEKKLHQQFFEVEIEPVPEVRDRGGIQRLISVAQQVEAGHATAGHHHVAHERHSQDGLQKVRHNTRPQQMQRRRVSSRSLVESRFQLGNAEMKKTEIVSPQELRCGGGKIAKNHRAKHQQQQMQNEQPHQKLDRLQLHHGQILRAVRFHFAKIGRALSDGSRRVA